MLRQNIHYNKDKSYKLARNLTNDFPFKCDEYNYSYGDKFVAAKYCGFHRTPKKTKGEWQHGHIVPERNRHPESVVGSDGLSRMRKNNVYYVQRRDQVDYLEKEGYTNVKAIGLPIIYVSKPKVLRIKSSILIMPSHCIVGSDYQVNEKKFLDDILKYTDKFEVIVFCIHKVDFDKGYWKDTLKSHDIPLIIGADNYDVNSLYRIANIFSQFDNLITDTFGSHVTYASYFGCKVSIIENEWETLELKENNLKFISNSALYKNCPELVSKLYLELPIELKISYPFLYVKPIESTENISWAEFQLGLENKKSPKDLRLLFGWPHPRLFLFKDCMNFLKHRSKRYHRYVKRILHDFCLK